jgi:hypothetical protein
LRPIFRCIDRLCYVVGRGSAVTTNARHKMRRAIGFIAAYALALQTILGSVAPRLAVAFDPTLPLDLAAICLSSHGSAAGLQGDIPDGSGNGSHVGDHCAMCTCSAPPLLAPPDSVRFAILVSASELIAPPPYVPSYAKAAAHPGGARAPPMIA